MKKKKKNKCTAGDDLLKMEKIVLRLVRKHGFQHGDILSNQNTYLKVHCPEAEEEYMDGTNPVFYFGPAERIISYSEAQKRRGK